MRRMEKVLVTGGAGFIGSHLAEELARRGYHVIILDDLSSGKLENIGPLLGKDNAEFIQGSITDPPLLQKLFQGIDYVFHQAAIPSVPRSIENPSASHEANITGTMNVLLAARDNGVSKVIYASSSSVYGDTPTLPKKEDMPPNPQSPYAVTKLAGEYYCRVFQEVYGLPTACLRYFNVYGPRQDPNSQYAAVIPKFIQRVSEGKPPIIFGDGEQTRDFTFIKDVVEANILAAESDATGVFNIARGESISINQLAQLILNLSKNSVKRKIPYNSPSPSGRELEGGGLQPIHEEPRLGDIKHSLADISKAKTFGYKPRYSLEEGLGETMRGFQHEI